MVTAGAFRVLFFRLLIKKNLPEENLNEINFVQTKIFTLKTGFMFMNIPILYN